MIDMDTLMEKVEWLDGGNIKKWCDEDPARFTLLHEALMNTEFGENVSFHSRSDTECSYDSVGIFYHDHPEFEHDKSGVANSAFFTWMLHGGHITINARIFKEWYYNIWPSNDITEPHMSNVLKVAIQCSRDLYGDGDLAEQSGTVQNKHIKTWLKNCPAFTGWTDKKESAVMSVVTHNYPRSPSLDTRKS